MYEKPPTILTSSLPYKTFIEFIVSIMRDPCSGITDVMCKADHPLTKCPRLSRPFGLFFIGLWVSILVDRLSYLPIDVSLPGEASMLFSDLPWVWK